MIFIGRWVFHSIASINENGEQVYLGAKDYIASPMPYIDVNDKEAVEDEIAERKRMTEIILDVCEDGKIYTLMPIPEGATKEEIDDAVKSGEFALHDGLLCFAEVLEWEERNGEFWYNTGVEGEIFGEKADPWEKAIDENGFFNYMTTRFIKEEK